MPIIAGGTVFDTRSGAAAPADILVSGSEIRSVGPPGSFGSDEPTIDARDRLIIPGLVNAHTHSHGNLQRANGDRLWTLELLLHAGPPDYGHQRLEDKYLTAKLGAAEMISKGCTACYDLFYEFPVPSVEGLGAVARAYTDAGMRAVIAPMLADTPFHRSIPGLIDALPAEARAQYRDMVLEPGDRLLALVERIQETVAIESDLVTFAIAPTIPLLCSDSFIRAAAERSAAWNVGVHMHVAESKVQAVTGLQRYGRSLIAHIDDLGLLSPRFTAAHCIWIDDEDIARLAGSGGKVAHNPGSNMRLGSGLAAVRRMLDGGVQVGVGTDSRLCSDNLNMFEAMRWAHFVSRVQGPEHRRWLTALESFTLATEGSAAALGLGDRIGAIAPGRRADLVFLDLGNLNYVPLVDTMNQVVNAEDGTAVRSVMIDGRMVYADGCFLTFDIEALRRNARAASERLIAANAEAVAAAHALQDVVGSFCGALGRTPHHVSRHVGGECAIKDRGVWAST